MTDLCRAVSLFMLSCVWLMGPASLATAQDADRAMFEVNFDITWSRETAPFEFPPSAHLSGVTGATHNDRFVLFQDGQTASSGVELVAENGRSKTLKAELEEIQRRGRLGTLIEGPALGTVPGSISLRFETSKAHPNLSLVTMIAPSPDWFTGISSVALVLDGKWIEQQTMTIWAWDSGTDSGSTYTAEDADTQPQESVRLVATKHFLGSNGLVPVGTVTIKRVAP